jgi:peptide deformylase
VINPEITESSAETDQAEEGCLSLPGIYYDVIRSARVRVEGTDLDGEPVVLEADDLLARVCQHEIDHLDGVLFIDRLQDEDRRAALITLRDQALGLATPTRRAPLEEQL